MTTNKQNKNKNKNNNTGIGRRADETHLVGGEDVVLHSGLDVKHLGFGFLAQLRRPLVARARALICSTTNQQPKTNSAAHKEQEKIKNTQKNEHPTWMKKTEHMKALSLKRKVGFLANAQG
jgi:hypothetical protein